MLFIGYLELLYLLFPGYGGYWILVLAIMCMISANKGEQKPLPVIGKIKIIK